jgi:hypothetical protein
MYQPLRIDYFDRKNSELKTLITGDWNQYLEQYWRPGFTQMTNHQTGKSTRLDWGNYQFKTGLGERDFDRNTLKRTR